jgi:hypothetical protein
MASPLRSAILRGYKEDEQETPQQEAAEEKAEKKAAPKPGLGALAAAIGKGKNIKKVTIVGGGAAPGTRQHGSAAPRSPKDTRPDEWVWDENVGQYVKRDKLSPKKPTATAVVK